MNDDDNLYNVYTDDGEFVGTVREKFCDFVEEAVSIENEYRWLKDDVRKFKQECWKYRMACLAVLKHLYSVQIVGDEEEGEHLS